jgi:hypothetical protein
MERPTVGTTPKKWKNIIFVNDIPRVETKPHLLIEEMHIKEAIAALTTALEDALREANQLPTRRSRKR